MIFGDDADASLRLHWEKLMLSSKNRSKRHHHALSDRLEKDIQSAATSIEANAKAAYFDFAALCGANAKWSPRDYENLSKAYEFVFLESIPVLDVAILGEDVVRRFVMVIDALYANKTKLYCSSPSTKSIADLFPQSSSTPSRENSSSSTATATTTFVSKTGGASGRNATMLSENIEWSATGLTKASLAALSSGSFTDKSKPRCQSRLYEMKNRGVQKRPPGVVLVVIVVIVVIVIVVVVREKSQQQHTQIVRDGRKKKGVGGKGFVVARVLLRRKAASFLLRKDDVESLWIFLHKITLVFYQNSTHTYTCLPLPRLPLRFHPPRREA